VQSQISNAIRSFECDLVYRVCSMMSSSVQPFEYDLGYQMRFSLSHIFLAIGLLSGFECLSKDRVQFHISTALSSFESFGNKPFYIDVARGSGYIHGKTSTITVNNCDKYSRVVNPYHEISI
jgi:hypothetical protein